MTKTLKNLNSYFLKIIIIFIFTVFITTLNFGLSVAHAEDSRIENAVGVRVTEKGQRIFKNNLQKLLFLNGVPTDSFYVQSMEFTQEQPLEVSPTVKEYLDIINLGTIGADIKPSQIHMLAQDFEADVHFDELGIQFIATQLNPGEGGGEPSITAILSAKISSFHAGVASVLADDLANPFLGQFGFKNFTLSSKLRTSPLEITVPLIITVKRGREDVGLSVGTILSSLSGFDLEYDFTSPAVLPDIEIIINGSHLKMDKIAVSNELLNKQDRLLRVVRTELDSYIHNALPAKINELLQDNVFKKFSEINLLAPIGANLEHNGITYNPVKPDDLFQWKISLDELLVVNNDLVTSLSASVRDPHSNTKIRLPKEAISKVNPAHEKLQYPSDQYDIAILLNQGFLNRFLELSFNRGYFDNIPSGEAGKKTEFLHISKSPLVRFDLSPEARDIVRVQIEVRPEVSGIEKLAVNSDFRVSITANVKIAATEKGYGLIVESIDEKSITMKRGFA